MASRVQTVPDAALVVVLTSAGPYHNGDTIALAYHEANLARLVSAGSGTRERSSDEIVPEVVLTRVVAATAHFAADDELLLSFTDPGFARVHVVRRATIVPEGEAPRAVIAQPVIAQAPQSASTVSQEREAVSAFIPTPSLQPVEPPPSPATVPAAVTRVPSEAPVTLMTEWSTARVRACVSVIDKLFTVERLGWYRHVFASRLLLADDIAGTQAAVEALGPAYQSFRQAASVALGAPLLDAYLPGFALDLDWLARLEDPAVAGRLGTLRANEYFEELFTPADRALLESGSSIHAWIPALIATDAPDARLNDALERYRSAALEAFARVANAEDGVRLGAMSQHNLLLDDRLWALAGALHESIVAGVA